MKIEEELKDATGWNPAPPQAVQVLADPDDIPEFNVAPWMIGLTQEDSIKGKSKLVHTMDVVQGFLKQPYNSKTEPLQMVFAFGSTVGSPIEDWSMRVCIGMSKASAARMILEAVSALDLPREELQAIAPVLKALLRMRCTYDPAPTEEEQFKRAMATKNMVTERPRPDPLMWASRWTDILKKQCVDFSSVIDTRLKSFNADRSEGFGFVDYEIAFIKASRRVGPSVLCQIPRNLTACAKIPAVLSFSTVRIL